MRFKYVSSSNITSLEQKNKQFRKFFASLEKFTQVHLGGSDIEPTRNDSTTLALCGHGSETILFVSMGHGKVIHFPVIIWFYKHSFLDILQQKLIC